MRKYILSLLAVLFLLTPVHSWEWLEMTSDVPAITIAADSTDCGSTLLDSAVSEITEANKFEEIRIIIKGVRDSVLTNDSLFIEVHAIDASTTAKSAIDTVAMEIIVDSLPTTFGRIGALYEFTYTDSTWYGYYYLLAIYKFDLGETQADTNLAGNTYGVDSIIMSGNLIKK